jgi:hypothetical protein
MIKHLPIQQMLDLGDSAKWEIEPIEVELCRRAGHVLEDVPILNSHNKHRITCKICNYTCTYRCSYCQKVSQ